MITKQANRTIDVAEYYLKDDVLYITVNNEYTAKEFLKRNSRAHVTRGDGEQYMLAYLTDNCNLLNIIKRH